MMNVFGQRCPASHFRDNSFWIVVYGKHSFLDLWDFSCAALHQVANGENLRSCCQSTV